MVALFLVNRIASIDGAIVVAKYACLRLNVFSADPPDGVDLLCVAYLELLAAHPEDTCSSEAVALYRHAWQPLGRLVFVLLSSPSVEFVAAMERGQLDPLARAMHAHVSTDDDLEGWWRRSLAVLGRA